MHSISHDATGAVKLGESCICGCLQKHSLHPNLVDQECSVIPFCLPQSTSKQLKRMPDAFAALLLLECKVT